jgi:hypothetical protein
MDNETGSVSYARLNEWIENDLQKTTKQLRDAINDLSCRVRVLEQGTSPSVISKSAVLLDHDAHKDSLRIDP